MQYFIFVRQADDFILWLQSKKHLCDREDYGYDLEECIKIIDQFSQVLHELACAGKRVLVIQKLHDELQGQGHPKCCFNSRKTNSRKIFRRYGIR